MEKNRRILVVSNNCFSPSNSNGRTLGNLFYGWPKDNLAQFCVIAKDPAWDVCDNYYCLEDRTMLAAFKHGRKAVGRRLQHISASTLQGGEQTDTQRRNIGKKTLPKMILRELVWAFNRWRSKDFEKWVNDFAPDVVVFQFGDSSFMIDIALYIAQSRHIPLVVYNTEGYYFFTHNWHYPSRLDSMLFPLYKNNYQKKVRKLMSYSSYSVYLNDKLQDDYDKEFGGKSSVIYNSSDLHTCSARIFGCEAPRISYLGNLGLDRDTALVEVGEVLYSINPCYHIDVFGNADERITKKLNDAKGVVFHGSVSYEKVKQVISSNDILFHVESERGYKERQLQYAFSGKIADSIASGKCFIIYAPRELACSKYIAETGAGWLAETQEELRNVMLNVLNNKEERRTALAKAKVVAERNHSFGGNAQKFQRILLNV